MTTGANRARAPAFDEILRRLPEGTERLPAAAGFGLHVAAVMIVYLAFDRIVDLAARLAPQQYFAPVLTLEMLVRIGAVPAIAAAAMTGLLIRYGALTSRWDALEHGSALRGFTVLLAALMAWPLATMGYNHYFDQAHAIDRVLLVGLLPLIWWRPAFLLAFAPVAFVVLGQLIEPALGGTVLAHKLQVLRALNLIAACVLVHAMTGLRATTPLVFLLCCYVAGAYWLPAVAKLELGWIGTDELYHMPLVAYAHGWLAFLSPERVVELARALVPFDFLMRIAVIVAEAGCIVILLRRGITLALLVAVILFHLGVFALYGFLFWPWIALDAALVVLLLPRQRWQDIHRPVAVALSIALILTAGWWARPPRLGWYDTPLAYVYRVDAQLASGERVPLHPQFFAPYEDTFTMTSFGYSHDIHAVLVGPYGVTLDRVLLNDLTSARTADDIFALERQRSGRYDPTRAEQLFEFLTRYARNRNRNGDSLSALYALHPPRQFISHAPGKRFLDGAQIEALILTEVTTFYDGDVLRAIREVEIKRLPTE